MFCGHRESEKQVFIHIGRFRTIILLISDDHFVDFGRLFFSFRTTIFARFQNLHLKI